MDEYLTSTWMNIWQSLCAYEYVPHNGWHGMYGWQYIHPLAPAYHIVWMSCFLDGPFGIIAWGTNLLSFPICAVWSNNGNTSCSVVGRSSRIYNIEITGNDLGIKYLQPFAMDEKLTPFIKTNRISNLLCYPLVNLSHTTEIHDTFDLDLLFCGEIEPYFE